LPIGSKEREVSAKRREFEDIEDPELSDEDPDEDLDDYEDPDASASGDDDEGEGATKADEDPGQASLEELLAQRAAARRGTDDSDDEADIMAFPSESARLRESLRTRVAPVRDRQEFVCKRCHLVKPRVQLADQQRGLCRDCV
jgi:Domain of unknown function (DUF4193)